MKQGPQRFAGLVVKIECLNLTILTASDDFLTGNFHGNA
jgi:hypothetical protein